MDFTKRIQERISQTGSCLLAGFDPVLQSIPKCFVIDEKTGGEEAVFGTLTSFYEAALDALKDSICAIKPNIAFFEQYGLGGVRAFAKIIKTAKSFGIPVIADVKRGDIGSTARAYSTAYLGGGKNSSFDVDAITVNPFLGFETLDPYLEDCRTFGKGIFVLVKTSNPGSSTIQGFSDSSGRTVSEIIAEWVSKNDSFVGAVVGGTDKKELARFRSLMPNTFFLIPGLGAQGGTPEDVSEGFTGIRKGALINLSRALLSSFSSRDVSAKQMSEELRTLSASFNGEIEKALRERFSN